MDRFLIVRFSAIGDCVMAAYIATAIRSKIRSCDLTWAVETRCAPVLDSSRLLTRICDFPRDEWRKRRWSPQTWRAQLARFSELRKHRYDFGMDLQGHSKTAVCLRIARPAKRIAAFATDNLAGKLNPLVKGDPDEVHRVERMLAAAQTFGDFSLPTRPIMPDPIPIDVPLDKPLATISTGAGAKIKQYSHWEPVATDLLRKGFNVMFLGAQPDPRIQVPGAIDRVAQFSLAETMSAVARSRVHLAADTGTGHMAAAYGVPFVAVFGPTNPKLYRPYSENGVVLRNSNDPNSVQPNEILAAVEGLIG